MVVRPGSFQDLQEDVGRLGPGDPYRRSTTKKGIPVAPSDSAVASSSTTSSVYSSPASTWPTSSRSSPASVASSANESWSKTDACSVKYAR
ncbi:MAG TPA: hypothetical protein VIX85_09525 [Acidimicrobiales bacterium]